ncbi:MAG TPA: DHA2 family efflux MFS transporter permease subunit [Mycobacteriales bacterium]|nr:DHA2 family efflux MFS transporter permease subunit [Mycobacteriales bacterium]
MNDQIHARRWWILSVLILSLVAVILDNTILNVALPTIQQTLHASQSQQEWIVDSYVLVFACLLFTAGVLADCYGRRRMLVAGLLVFGAGSLASALATSPGWLIATRALMGIGGAAIMPSTLSIISTVFEPAERGRAIGIWAGFSGMGIAAGPLAGGALLTHFWWGSVFLVNVPIVGIAVTAAMLIIPESRTPDRARIDVPGVLLSVAALGALIFGIIRAGSDNSFTETTAWLPMATGVVLLVAFAFVESRSDHPALDIALFRNRSFAAGSAAITAVFFALFGATFFLTFYLQFVRAYSPFQAGLRLLPVAAAIVFLAPRSARLVARFGPKSVVAGGLSLVAVAFVIYQFVDVHSSIWVVELLLVLQGVGMANTMAPATTAIMSALPRERAGAGAAVNNTTRQLGGALGVAILGSVLSASYRAHAGSALALLPSGTRRAAGESIGGTLAVARAHGGRSLLAAVRPAADGAFVQAMHLASLGSALVAAVGAVIVAVWLPGRDRAGTDTTYPGDTRHRAARAAAGV